MKFQTKIFADGADVAGISSMAAHPMISGFTTNPTLMRKAGISDYERFAREVLQVVPDLPISFEVFSDDFPEMEKQALKIASWGENVFVKIPVTNTRGESSAPLITRLAGSGVKTNVTAMMTPGQVKAVLPGLAGGPAAFVSIFAGRIADSGRDPIPLMEETIDLLCETPHVELIWASPREVLNLVQANAIGCHVITMTNDLIGKIALLGKDLEEFSLDTVKMFDADARAAGFRL